ncbi:MAG: B12-binding domain-containing radical SAM protein [Promethearchaeota archaeon]|nr:MAG: B12-binding domain-containing radical SAM protein [Candidatus Lokiarchaeota archaeon]
MDSDNKDKKILFVEPSGSKANVFTFAMKLPLLGPIHLATKLHQAGYDVLVIKEDLLDKSDKIENYLPAADILILTLLTNSAFRGYEIATKYREIRPDGRIIIGGIHASLNPEEPSQYADQVAVGEGDNIIIDLIKGNLSDKIVYGTPLENLDERPIPDFSLMINAKKSKVIPIMTSLGCPFNCTFCCVTLVYGRKYRIQTPERTIEEIKQQLQFFKKKKIFFYDDNFCAKKRISLELLDRIKEEKLKFKWITQVRADLANDEEFVKKMAEAGCRRVFIGFESINDATLKDLNKNETSEEVRQAVKVFQRYGISVHGMFIFGSDEDNPEVFKNTIKFCRKNLMEFAQFLAITPFPGTEYYKSIEKSRIVSENWDNYDGFHVNVKPKNMSEKDVMDGILRAYKKVFGAWKIFRQFCRDFIYLFRFKCRTFKYRANKMFNDFARNVGMRIGMRRWKKLNKEYMIKISENTIDSPHSLLKVN